MKILLNLPQTCKIQEAGGLTCCSVLARQFLAIHGHRLLLLPRTAQAALGLLPLSPLVGAARSWKELLHLCCLHTEHL